MKNTIIKYVFAILIFASFITAGAYLVSFQAKSDGTNVILEWQTQSEDNLKEFVIQRKPLNGNYTEVIKIAAKGSFSSYSFTDKTAYKTTEQFYQYKLVFIDNNGQEDGYSSPVSVAHNVSSVKRTWGSIKALFR